MRGSKHRINYCHPHIAPLATGSPVARGWGIPCDPAPSSHPRLAPWLLGAPSPGGGTPRDRAPSSHTRLAPLATGSPISAKEVRHPHNRAPTSQPCLVPLATGSHSGLSLFPILSVISSSPLKIMNSFTDGCTTPLCTPSDGVPPSLLGVISFSSSLNINNSIPGVFLFPVILGIISFSFKQKFETITLGACTPSLIYLLISSSPWWISRTSLLIINIINIITNTNYQY